MNRGCFIVGTDTGVGKTVVGAALARSIRDRGYDVGVCKPIETGLPSRGHTDTDAYRLRTAAGADDPFDLVCPYRFPAPLAPLAAARLAGTAIRASVIRRAFARLAERHDIMIVEGAGGLLVPLTRNMDLLDVVCDIGLPVLVVGRAALGGVNHAMMTVEALRARHVKVLALVLNLTTGGQPSKIRRTQQQSTVRLLRERCPVPVIGPLRYEPGLRQSWAAVVARVAASPTIRTVARLTLRTGR